MRSDSAMQCPENLINVAFFGRTGVGKTSTINALFNLDWRVEHGKAATKELTKKVVSIDRDGETHSIRVIDTPGFAESTLVDYADCYKEAAQMADCIFWLYQADVRYFSADQKALLKIGPFIPEGVPFFIGLNHVDLIYPQDWNSKTNRPSAQQSQNIPFKSEIVMEKLRKYVPGESVSVIHYSAKQKYELERILEKIITSKRGIANA